jgi:hypothetical protein
MISSSTFVLPVSMQALHQGESYSIHIRAAHAKGWYRKRQLSNQLREWGAQIRHKAKRALDWESYKDVLHELCFVDKRTIEEIVEDCKETYGASGFAPR